MNGITSVASHRDSAFVRLKFFDDLKFLVRRCTGEDNLVKLWKKNQPDHKGAIETTYGQYLLPLIVGQSSEVLSGQKKGSDWVVFSKLSEGLPFAFDSIFGTRHSAASNRFRRVKSNPTD